MMRAKESFPDMPLIASGGIGTSEDLIKAILAGACAGMVTSAIYRNGVATLGNIRDGLAKFMSDRGLNNLCELQALCPPIMPPGELDLIAYTGLENEGDPAQTVDIRISGDRFGHPVN
jgi:dihydroorotate dehydrogenase (fumarate)